MSRFSDNTKPCIDSFLILLISIGQILNSIYGTQFWNSKHVFTINSDLLAFTLSFNMHGIRLVWTITLIARSTMKIQNTIAFLILFSTINVALLIVTICHSLNVLGVRNIFASIIFSFIRFNWMTENFCNFIIVSLLCQNDLWLITSHI